MISKVIYTCNYIVCTYKCIVFILEHFLPSPSSILPKFGLQISAFPLASFTRNGSSSVMRIHAKAMWRVTSKWARHWFSVSRGVGWYSPEKVYPGKLTFWTQKWRWMEDDFLFNLVIFRFNMLIFRHVFVFLLWINWWWKRCWNGEMGVELV